MALLGDMNVKIGADISELLSKVDAAKAKLNQLTETDQQLKASVNDLNSSLKQNETELGKTASQLRKLVDGGKGATLEAKKLRTEIAGLASNSATLTTKLAATKTQLASTTVQIKAQTIALKQAETAGGGFAKGASKAFSALRTLANIIPGIGIGGLVALISGPVIEAFEEWVGITNKTTEAQKKLKESLENVFDAPAKEAAGVISLIAVLKSETETRERKLAAIRDLQKINPEVFGQLKLEEGVVKGLDSAYQKYLESLKTVIAAKILQAKLEDKVTQLLKLQGIEESTIGKNIEAGLQRLAKQQGNIAVLDGLQKTTKKTAGGIVTLNNDIADLEKRLTELSKGVKLDPFKPPDGPAKEKIKKVAIEYTETLQHALRELFEKGFQRPIDPFASLDSKGKIDTIKKLFPTEEIIAAGKVLNDNQLKLERTAQFVTDTLAPVFENLFSSIASGSENAFEAFGHAITGLLQKLAVAVAKAAALAAIMSLIIPVSKGGLGFSALFNKFLGFAEGGEVKGKGTSKSDSILARLSAGEYVLKADTVKRIGVSNLDKLNKGGAPSFTNFLGGKIPHLASGGFISPAMASNILSGSIGGGQSIQVFGRIEAQGDKLVTIIDRATARINRNS